MISPEYTTYYYDFHLMIKKFFGEYIISDGHRRYKVSDLFYFSGSFPYNYRARWFLSVLSDVTGKDVLDLCCEHGEWGVYLQVIDKKAFNYTALDSGIYGKKIKPFPNEQEWLKPIWILLDKENEAMIRDCTIPEAWAHFINDYFKRLKIQGKFVLHNISRKEPLPFTKNSFDMVWLFGFWLWDLDCFNLFLEIRRILRPEGQFIFEMPKKSETWAPRICMEKSELISTLKETGFTIDCLENILPPENVKHRQTFGVVCR